MIGEPPDVRGCAHPVILYDHIGSAGKGKCFRAREIYGNREKDGPGPRDRAASL
jgi:hypothetical protein